MNLMLSGFLNALGVVLLGFIPFVYFYEFLSRKIRADLQARVGPKEIGMGGFFQPAVDFVRLMRKTRVDLSRPEFFVYLIVSLCVFSMISVVPMGPGWIYFSADSGIWVPIAGGLLSVVSIMWLALSRGEHVALVGVLKWISVLTTALLTLVIALAAVGLEIGSLKWTQILEIQQDGFWSWNVFRKPPFFFLVFLSYLIGGLAFFDLEPLNSFSGSELGGPKGVGRLFPSRYFLLFGLMKRVFLFVWILLSVCIFFGAWYLPFFDELSKLAPHDTPAALVFVQLLTLFSKALVLLLLLHWFSGTLSKLRSEQVSELLWKIFIPISLFSFIAIVLWILIEIRPNLEGLV